MQVSAQSTKGNVINSKFLTGEGNFRNTQNKEIKSKQVRRGYIFFFFFFFFFFHFLCKNNGICFSVKLFIIRFKLQVRIVSYKNDCNNWNLEKSSKLPNMSVTAFSHKSKQLFLLRELNLRTTRSPADFNVCFCRIEINMFVRV